MMTIYDMVTYSLCAPTDTVPGDAPDQATVTARNAAASVRTELGLQLIEAEHAPREAKMHPTLRYTDVASFLATLDN